jgi:SAM-dependent methyltransferase
MGTSGPDFFDEDAVFETYMMGRQRRRHQDSPNDTLEKPILLELAGELSGKRILDLGCGDAAFGREVLEQGCHAYLGVDGSQKMVATARKALAGSAGQVVHSTVEGWAYPESAFDLVVARLVLHYVADIQPVFGGVYRTLSAGGRFVFSVEHPVITSCDRGRPPGTQRQDWIVDDYFETGLRVTSWLGSSVEKYHRTVEDYFAALQAAGFTLERLRESRPQRALFVDAATYERRKRIPLFLFLAGDQPVS